MLSTLELISANIHSDEPVVMLLTDLQQHWQFSWLTLEGTQECHIGLSQGITLLEDILNGTGEGPYRNRCGMKQYLENKIGIKEEKKKDVDMADTVDEASMEDGLRPLEGRPCRLFART